MKEIYIGMMP